MADREQATPEEEVRRLYEEAETRTAKAMERVVSRESFGELLAMATENLVSLAKLGNDAMDLVVRNLRVAGRRDVVRLGQQLVRTEDKLELVLQEVERLQEQLGEREGVKGTDGKADGKAGRSRSRSGRSSS